jgi:hypothetical protein
MGGKGGMATVVLRGDTLAISQSPEVSLMTEESRTTRGKAAHSKS